MVNLGFNDLIPIRYIVHILRTKWYWFLFSTTTCIFITILINRYSNEVYSNKTTINLDYNSIEKKSLDQMLHFNSQSSSNYVFDKIISLTSYSLIYETIDDLDFNIEYLLEGKLKNSEAYSICPIVFEPISLTNNFGLEFKIDIVNNNQFDLTVAGNSEEALHFGEVINTDYGSFKIVLNDKINNSKISDYPNIYVKWLNPHTVTTKYINKLKVKKLSKSSSIIEVSIAGQDIGKETLFLNKLTENFLKNTILNKNKASLNIIQFIDDQLIEIKDTMGKIESTLLDFKSKNGVVKLNVESEQFFKDITNLQEEKSKIIVENKYLEYLSNYINSKSSYEDIIVPLSYGISNRTLTELISDLIDFQVERNVLNPNGNLNNPIINELDIKIERIISSIESIIESLNAKNAILLADFSKRINSSEKLLNFIPSAERQLVNIERNYELSERIYLELMSKRMEAAITAAGHVSDAKIVEPAIVQTGILISPNKKQNLLIAFIVGLLIPLLITIINQLLNNTIVSSYDIKNNSKIPFVGYIFRNHTGFNIIVEKKPKSKISESFRNVRSNLEFLISKNEGSKTLLFTSSISGEGKTFCALNLATIYAKSGKKTLVVGADLRKPKLSQNFMYDNNLGLSIYLSNKIQERDKIIFDSQIENLFFIPSGPIPPNPAELVGNEKMLSLLSELKKEYDYIIIDSPPIFIVADAIPLMKFVDLNLYITRYNYTQKDLLKFINNFYEKNTLKNLSLVLNDVDFSKDSGYNYAYDYEYYMSYDSDYYFE